MTSRHLIILVVAVLLAPLAVRAGEIRGRVVDERGVGVADAVVFVAEPTTADSAAPAASEPAEMRQHHKQFVPQVLPVPVGTRVEFPNHDQIHHHVYSFSPAKTFEIPLYKGERVPGVVFDQVGAVKLGCNIHDWMSAVILVVPNEHFARTNPDGSFRLPPLPPGRYRVQVWHERQRGAVAEREVEVREAGGRAGGGAKAGEEGASVDVRLTVSLHEERQRRPVYGVRGYR